MKLLLCALFLFIVQPDGDRWLNKIELYNRDSYFKEKVYNEKNWKSFFQMKEANEVVDPDNYDFHLLSAAVFYATNELRTTKKLKELTYFNKLRDAATIHTHQMIEKNFFAHYNNKTPRLRSPSDRIAIAGVEPTEEGENLDYTFIELPSETTYAALARSIVKDWLESPPHKKVMLSKTFRFLGCAAIFETKDKGKVRYVKATQNFAR